MGDATQHALDIASKGPPLITQPCQHDCIPETSPARPQNNRHGKRSGPARKAQWPGTESAVARHGKRSCAARKAQSR
eukprot:7374128-Alexandrium_andersonii.AAC.1